jgi:hypothetical protein
VIRVGAAARDILIGAGMPLAGYALRSAACTGQHDPLRARVVLIDDGRRSVALVVLDLLYVPTSLDTHVRTAVVQAAGVAADAVLVSATHTHSGPANLGFDESLRARVVDAVRDAAAAARASAGPAVLASATRTVTGVGANRRRPGGFVDDTVRILLARTVDGSRTIATLVAFACHATVLDHRNTKSSADFPGALCRQLERRIGGIAVYLQGAAGDVNPLLATDSDGAEASSSRSGQPDPVAAGHAECERIGGMLADAAVGAVRQATGLQRGLHVVSPTAQTPFPITEFADCRMLDDTRLDVRWTDVALEPGPEPPPAAQIDRARRALPGPPGAEDARLWIQQLRARDPNLFGMFDVPTPTLVRLQCIDIGPSISLLAIPGEPFGATAAALRATTDRELIVVGYAHSSIGYLPPREEWQLGGYEVGCCLYADTAEPRLRAAALALLHDGATHLWRR